MVVVTCFDEVLNDLVLPLLDVSSQLNQLLVAQIIIGAFLVGLTTFCLLLLGLDGDCRLFRRHLDFLDHFLDDLLDLDLRRMLHD